MSISTSADGIRALTLDQLQVSKTESQAQRRKHFDKAALADLAKSIKKVGVLQAVIARPVNGHFEIVAGERRVIAAKNAGLTAISVDVRTLSDEDVIEIQLIENLQREGLHELAEAEGYEALMKLGHSADEVAEKLNKTKSYIYARVKLLALCADARKAFYEGKFPASSALLLARIPMPVQLEALKEITNNPCDDAPMSFREVKRLIQETYMLRLADAPFPAGDADLLPKAGACGACPKRTGNQPELFEDVKGKDLCTDPACFKMKRDAWANVQITKAKEIGRQVIVGAEAKKIAPYGEHSFAAGFTKLDEKCWEDPKHRTYKQILGKEAEPVLVQLPKGGLVELVQKNDAIRKLKADGVIKPQASGQIGASKKKADASKKKAEKIDKDFAERLFLAIHAKAPKKVPHALLVKVVDHELDAIGMTELLQKAWAMKDFSPKGLAKLNEGQLHQLLFEIGLLDEIDIYGASGPSLLKAAKDLGIDVKEIRGELAAAAKSDKPAKKTKGKKK